MVLFKVTSKLNATVTDSSGHCSVNLKYNIHPTWHQNHSSVNMYAYLIIFKNFKNLKGNRWRNFESCEIAGENQITRICFLNFESSELLDTSFLTLCFTFCFLSSEVTVSVKKARSEPCTVLVVCSFNIYIYFS